MTAQPEPLIVENLVRRFPVADGEELTVLDGASFQADPGQAVAIVGPSGSGKSTLLNIIGGLDRPTAGTVMLGDTNVGELEGAELATFRALRVGFVFQEHHLLPQLSALENVLMPTLAIGREDDAEHRAEQLIERVGLTERQYAPPAQLSGGERQRVAVARALVNGVGLLLCDEPTGNLDRQTGDSVVRLLLELAGNQDATVLMVTHNARQAAMLERTLQLQDGRLVPIEAHDASGAGQ